MKKIFFTIILVSLSILVKAQLSGTGSFASPYSGIFQGDLQWNSSNFPGAKVYINGDVTIDNELLTIEAGMSVIFLAEGADLIITGSGQLNASGSAVDNITFTADDDNDGNYGEAGEAWGHIYFNSPSESNQSKIDHCIIEYGDVHLFSDYQGYGGAIHSNFSNLVLSNSTLRNNYSEWGGAVFVNSGKNPAIRNCYIINNKSDRGGGGIYCWNSSSSVIENCIFEGNQCLEPSVPYYTGGALAGQSNTSIKVVNCSFVNNTSTRTEGQALMLHSSPNARIINSIFWGAPDKQIYCYGTPGSVVINSAYRGITYTTGAPPVSPVILNSSNDAPDGPNFVNPGTSGWSLKFISPCRDKGVNTYTWVTIPSLDYAGNPRIGTKEMGTYEVQYSLWTGSSSTTWSTSANWDQGIDPSSGTGDIVIPSGLTNYPTGSTTQDYTIASGRQMIIQPDARVTLNNLVNNGILKLNHAQNTTGFASLIANSYTRGGGGSEEIQLYLAGGGSDFLEDYKWHYISVPVASVSTNVFTGVTLDLAQFVESRPALSLLQGWVAFDGYVYSTGLSNGPTFSSLVPGKGYNFWDNDNNTFTFGGLLNTSGTVVSIPFSGVPSLHGFNLLGNPFSSGLNWDIIANDAGYPANTSKGVYFSRNNQQCTYIGGVGIPGDVTGIIPPMQGFFTKTYSTGNSINLSASARTHSGIHARYKGATIIPMVRIAIDKDSVLYDETVVRFDDMAKTGIDNEFDAVKMFLSSGMISIHTTSEGDKFAINGQPFPVTESLIPVVINVPAEGNHHLTATQLQGLDNYNVTLIDNETGSLYDLKAAPDLMFYSPAGNYADRFVLKVSTFTSGTELPEVQEKLFNIYQAYGTLNIQSLSDNWEGLTGSVKIMDLTGRIVAHSANVGFHKNSLIRIAAPATKGLYLVELKAGMLRYAGKVVIR